jgi:hypothetical protein
MSSLDVSDQSLVVVEAVKFSRDTKHLAFGAYLNASFAD